eukprot:431405_1
MNIHRNINNGLVDHSHQLYHFFDLYRTPFGIICAASLYAIFQATSKHRIDQKKGWEKFATRQLHIAFVTPFVLSLTVLLVATMTTSTILRGDFDPKAESAYDLMMREYKFQYVGIQWCCIVSIISLIRGIYIYWVLDNGLLHDKKEEFAMVVFDLFSFITGALAYVNSSLYSWDSFYEMTCDLFKMIWHGYIDELKPLRALSLFSAGITLGLFLKVTFFNVEGFFGKFICDNVENKQSEHGSTLKKESSIETDKKHQ